MWLVQIQSYLEDCCIFGMDFSKWIAEFSEFRSDVPPGKTICHARREYTIHFNCRLKINHVSQLFIHRLLLPNYTTKDLLRTMV